MQHHIVVLEWYVKIIDVQLKEHQIIKKLGLLMELNVIGSIIVKNIILAKVIDAKLIENILLILLLKKLKKVKSLKLMSKTEKKVKLNKFVIINNK